MLTDLAAVLAGLAGLILVWFCFFLCVSLLLGLDSLYASK